MVARRYSATVMGTSNQVQILADQRMDGFGDRLKRARKRRGMTQTDAGKLVDVFYTTWLKWERDQALPDVGLLARICIALRTEPQYLLGFKQRRKKEEPCPTAS